MPSWLRVTRLSSPRRAAQVTQDNATREKTIIGGFSLEGQAGSRAWSCAAPCPAGPQQPPAWLLMSGPRANEALIPEANYSGCRGCLGNFIFRGASELCMKARGRRWHLIGNCHEGLHQPLNVGTGGSIGTCAEQLWQQRGALEHLQVEGGIHGAASAPPGSSGQTPQQGTGQGERGRGAQLGLVVE